jgi:hypothetical protein
MALAAPPRAADEGEENRSMGVRSREVVWAGLLIVVLVALVVVLVVASMPAH